MTKQVITDGVIREWWNDLATTQADGTAQPIPARSVRFYTAGGAVQSTRAYTAPENVEADVRQAGRTKATNESTLRANIVSDLAAMQAIKADTNANINTNPAQRLKDIAVAVRRLERIALGDFSGTD